jgi:hypothetical protein
VLRWWRHLLAVLLIALLNLYCKITAERVLPVVLQVPGRANSVLHWWRHLLAVLPTVVLKTYCKLYC